ncbi:hypothetical protein PsorP6_009040 [Peronosclerospora sorghi]|uniref:Uncharacterized protein n=1 Tax=Peronosclerospora sorghi TaxID=230839 RepID=A0ACC0VZN9_9STRA|nr:hypothetical protein PsorP6_009040 [Peronosclerospora sorghi]
MMVVDVISKFEYPQFSSMPVPNNLVALRKLLKRLSTKSIRRLVERGQEFQSVSKIFVLDFMTNHDRVYNQKHSMKFGRDDHIFFVIGGEAKYSSVKIESTRVTTSLEFLCHHEAVESYIHPKRSIAKSDRYQSNEL